MEPEFKPRWQGAQPVGGGAVIGAAYMDLAFEQARLAGEAGEVPVGAVLIDPMAGQVLAAARNQMKALADPTAHAEIQAIRAAAARLRSPRLPGLDLYVTLEPCAMCAAAISFARIRRVYYGAYDPKGGGVDHGVKFYDQPSCHHRPEAYGGFQEVRAAALLRQFFAERR